MFILFVLVRNENRMSIKVAFSKSLNLKEVLPISGGVTATSETPGLNGVSCRCSCSHSHRIAHV